MLKTQGEHRYKFHCTIHHLSRDIAKTRFQYCKSSDTTKKGKNGISAMPRSTFFCDFPSETLPRIWTACANKVKVGLFIFFIFSKDKLWLLSYLFGSFFVHISDKGKKKEKTRPAFSSLVGA